MASRFQNKTVVLTGAASGIALCCAQKYADEGGRVCMVDVNEEGVLAAAAAICAKGGTAVGVRADIRDYAQVKAAVALAVERFGGVDIMVNCAGGASSRVKGYVGVPYHELPVEVIDWGLDVNLKGAVYFCHAVLGQMIKQKGGVFINLGSVDGLTGSTCLDYGAAKSAMIGLTKSLTVIGSPHGIRACCVSPGPVLTRPEMARMKTRLGRAAETHEVADLILYLSSDQAAFITGANYVIDG
ncbi:MAG TPA: SDR family oxidoreductase, partial [Phycisphaerae bacterium]|nr:SDR family oxidoreductase [Phycisphaerae bacterium]